MYEVFARMYRSAVSKPMSGPWTCSICWSLHSLLWRSIRRLHAILCWASVCFPWILFGSGQIRALVIPVCRDPGFSDSASKIDSKELLLLCSFVSLLKLSSLDIFVWRIGPRGAKKAENMMIMKKKPILNRCSLVIELAVWDNGNWYDSFRLHAWDSWLSLIFGKNLVQKKTNRQKKKFFQTMNKKNFE